MSNIFVNMSDNEDLLGDDLGDHSLADYNLGNEEEEQLLADDYESGGPQNVPSSVPYRGAVVPPEYAPHAIEYTSQPLPYQPLPEAECVVPNITVEVPNVPPERRPFAPYNPIYEPEHAVVPPPIPAAPVESPQIVPSEMSVPIANGDMVARARFISERPPGMRTPQVRDIPDTLDKVVLPRGGFPPRGRTWRNPQLRRRTGNYMHRQPYPPAHMRFHSPQMRPEMRPIIRPEMQDIRPEILPDIRPPLQMGPEISPERPILPQEPFRPVERPFQPNFPRFQFRPNIEDRPFAPMRPNFEQRPYEYRPSFPRYAPPVREIVPSSVNHMPQVTIRMPDKDSFAPKVGVGVGREQEVRMLPVLPNLPPTGLAGKKVLINPHFKGNFQPPVEGLPTYIPTRIQKTPPLSPTLENKFGPIKDIDDAAERFIAEQRNALARAASRKQPRRSPQRYIENTTIEIENELAQGRREDDELLRRQEEFINANRAGLRRRMRSPPRRSPPPSPRRSPDRRPRPDDEESEYKRRVREQESLRERVLRAKEVRRRRTAAAMHSEHREREEKEAVKPTAAEVASTADVSAPDTRTDTRPDTRPDARPEPRPDTRPEPRPEPRPARPSSPSARPDTTRRSPAPSKPVRAAPPAADDKPEVNSTCEALTPPRAGEALTPPLPDSDDDLDLILGDIDGILSDDDDTPRLKEKPHKSTTQTENSADLRSKLPPRGGEKPPRQKIVFNEDKKEKKRKEKSPPRRAAVTSSSKAEDADTARIVKKMKAEAGIATSRQKIIFEKREAEKEKEKEERKREEEEKTKSQFSNRRVILQRKVTQPKEKSVFSRIEVKNDPTKPNPGIFSRAVRTAIGNENRIIVKKDEPQIEYDSESGDEEDKLLQDTGNVAMVTNLPHGMTDTRLKTLAGIEVQSLILDTEDRSAKITFKTTVAADSFKKKFNNKMVAASRLTVALQ